MRIALDVHLPAEAHSGGRVPAILRQTRYYRGVRFRHPFSRLPIDWLLDHAAVTRRRFVSKGYAWIDVCARGSGASFGTRPCPWSPDEVRDGAEVVDYIVRQPWSNGLVGATGVSYDGTAAEFLLVNGHPAVRAIVPRFSLFDVYTDIAFPGGIHLSWFTESWGAFNRALDDGALDAAFARMVGIQLAALRGDELVSRRMGAVLKSLEGPALERVVALMLRRVASGVNPVDGDRDGALLAAAIRSHRDNFNVHDGALQIDFRDDTHVSPAFPDETIDFFSPHRYVGEIRASGAAIYSYSGWLDGAYARAAVKRFGTLRDAQSRLILGPWDHGGMQNVSPYSPSHRTAFNHDREVMRFFDRHLRGCEPDDDDPPVRYFTIGEERWHEAQAWPPRSARPRRLYLGDARSLSAIPPSRAGIDEYRVDPDVGTGRRSRYESLLGLLVPTGYPDRSRLGSRLLVYRSAPLEEPLTVTGHPLVVLYLSADREDAFCFAYLEDERPDGRVDYVSEGQLRALCRKLSGQPSAHATDVPQRSFLRADAARLEHGRAAELRFDLHPISWRFARGHRLRLAIAGADADHFEKLPFVPTFGIHRGGEQASFLELPVIGG